MYKQFLGLVIGVIILFTFVSASSAETFSDASNIVLNSTITDNLASSSDKNYYKFDLSSPGKVMINFQHEQVSRGSWRIYILDSNNKTLTDKYSGSDEINVNSLNLRLPSGTYYAKVTPSTFSNSDYKITIKYSAEDMTYEKEPNDSLQNAYNVDLNKTYTGNLQSSRDNDYFKVELPSQGELKVNFQHDQVSSGSWKFYILDSNNKVLTDKYSGGEDISVDSLSLRLPTGTYYVKVVSSTFNDTDYKFTLHFSGTDQFSENEPNDSLQTAYSIETNKTYTGNLQSSRDSDYFKFNLTSAGKVTINFQHEQVNNGSWKLYVLDSNNKTMTEKSSGKDEINVSSSSLRLAAGTYYVKIGSYNFNNSNYKITVNYSPEDGTFESEPNNLISMANSIDFNKTYTGNIQSSDDRDYFMFNMTTPGKITVNFKHEQVSNGSWKIYVFDSNNKELTSKNSGREDVNLNTSNLNLSGGTYYIKVAPNTFNNSDYTVQVLKETQETERTNDTSQNSLLQNSGGVNSDTQDNANSPAPIPNPEPVTTPTIPSPEPVQSSRIDRATSRLSSINAIRGYSDGSFKTEAAITRAEFAAIVVRLKGLENMVDSAKGASKFWDVGASHWASGYVNLAVANGIISGYPDGSFKPEANVTYAEMASMLVRLLGYGPQLTGSWPTNVIGKSAQLGLLDDVYMTNYDAAATRGNVFIASDNALDVKHPTDSKTLLEKLKG